MFASQTPLNELIVFHPDPEYLDDVRSLLPYVEQELNVRTVTFSSDEALCGIKYRAEADIKVLGKKLRNNLGRVKAGLTKITSEDVKTYLSTKTISIDGIELGEGDLTASRYVELPPHVADGSPHYETNTDNDVVILLDVLRRPELEQEGTAREVINRVQRLRKKAGVVATDDIDVFYSFAEGVGAELNEIIVSSEVLIVRVLKKMPQPDHKRNASLVVLIEEEQEIGDEKLVLTLVKMG